MVGIPPVYEQDNDMAAPGEDTDDQDELERDSRQSGGDAEAAGSMAEREALATDQDDAFDDEDPADEED